MSDNFDVAMRFPTRIWQIIDGTLDNTVSMAAVDPDPDLVAAGMRIREAGWEQITGWTRENPVSRGWPPDDELVTLTLPRDAWDLVLAELDRWNAVSARVGDDEDVKVGQAVRQMVREQLP